MADAPLKRKLAAIFSTDVKGYSRLMEDDEEATVQTIKSYRHLISSTVEKYRGRVVDSPGDNILAEFASVVDAARSAVEIQRELRKRNESLPEHRRMEFRIGINLGDVIEDDGRIYGDGVNIAARIEGVADPGGVCISESAYHHIKNKLPHPIEALGSFEVKNIAEPIAVYRINLAETGRALGPRETAGSRNSRRSLFLFLALGGMVVAGALWVWTKLKQEVLPPPQDTQASGLQVSVSEEPSIAVLPLQNISGDSGQEYFSDGMTNDIITDLSRFKDLIVIASSSVFTYKGKAIDVRDVGRELGVRYVLEGSVQRTGDKLRLNVQLIDASSGHHLWARRYERNVEDIFAVQDEIVETIVATLAIQIREVEQDLAMSKDIHNLGAYDYLMRGWRELAQETCDSNAAGRELFENAMNLEPNSSRAVSATAFTYLSDFLYGCTEFPHLVLDRAQSLSEKALKINASDALAHRILGHVHSRRSNFHLAVEELNRALELNPNDAHSYGYLGSVLLYSGYPEEAIVALERAKRLNPNLTRGAYMNLGLAYYLMDRFEQAIKVLTRGIVQHPDFAGNYIVTAAAYARSSQPKEAGKAVEEALRLHPFFSLDDYGSAFQRETDRESIKEGLRLAGFH